MADSVGVVHVHSAYSHDSRDSLASLREFALARDLRFVGLTDHAEDFDADKFAAYRAECAALSDDRVTLIAGLEFRFEGYTGLHLLALGLTRWITPAKPADFIADTRGVTRLIIAAHPVLFKYQMPDEVRAGIDAIEVWNAKYNTRYLPDPLAIRLLHAVRRTRPDVVGTVGLDQHDATNDRKTRIIIDAAASDPLAEIRAGRFQNRGLNMTFGPEVAWPVYGLPLLEATRFVFDRVEQVQERWAKRAKAKRTQAK
ncbi:MAG TPA: PHP domain-containing protein [Gemmatimonadaceae bacterium]|nr:PHP domain-containing protein [Gemmatimonadaceae bacterium]